MAEWFPTRRDDVIHMADAWAAQLDLHGPDWNVPEAAISDLKNQTQTAKTLLAEVKSGGRTPVNTEQCRTQFRDLESLMRILHGSYFNSPPRTGDERIALLLSLADRHPSPIPRSDTVPGLSLHNTDGHGMLLRLFTDAPPADLRSAHHFFVKWGLKLAGRWASPEEAAADPRLLIRPPVRAEDLPMHFSTKRKTHDLPFSLADISLELFATACWQTPSGEDGPYCPVVSRIIS
jgi:hypothetical protein